MKDKELISLCLTGMICRENPDEQKRCIVSIKKGFGDDIAAAVRRRLGTG